MTVDYINIAIGVASLLPMLLALGVGIVAASLTSRGHRRSSGLLGAGLVLALGSTLVFVAVRWSLSYLAGWLFSAGAIASYDWITAVQAVVGVIWGLAHGAAFVLVALAALAATGEGR